MTAIAAIREGFARVSDLVAPRVCAACDVPIGFDGDRLCVACWSDLAVNVGGYACSTCGKETGPHLLIEGRCTACRDSHSGHIHFHHFLRVGRYEGVLKALILRFKYRYVLDDLLGGLLAEVLANSDIAKQVDMWVPVPSHWRQRMKRGYQPTRLLAARALQSMNRKPTEVLVSVRYVKPFHGVSHMTRTHRIEAVKGAFRVSADYDLQGCTVGLIDDVCTTGATLAECARTLRRAGAKRIVAAVVAKTSEQGMPSPGVDPDRPST